MLLPPDGGSEPTRRREHELRRGEIRRRAGCGISVVWRYGRRATVIYE